MNDQVSHTKLVNFANNKTLINKPYIFGHFCQSVTYWNNDLAQDMAEQFIPIAQAALDQDSVKAFKELEDGYFTSVLRVFDPLNVYVGKDKPNRRQWTIARGIFKDSNLELMADQLSSIRIRDFQSAAGLLYLMYRCVPRKYDQVLNLIDWSRLSKEIGEYWTDPPHEVEALLSSDGIN